MNVWCVGVDVECMVLMSAGRRDGGRSESLNNVICVVV